MEEESPLAAFKTSNVALIVGVTGLVGRELAAILTRYGWKVYGIARRREEPINQNYQFISCDLLDPIDTMNKLSSLEDTTHVFWVTWASQFPLETLESYNQNKDMMCNALGAILPKAKWLKHVCLQTGTKHYLNPRAPPPPPPPPPPPDANNNNNNNNNCDFYDEVTPRVPNSFNFYYALEDVLREKLAGKVGWSVHRPGIVMGNSRRTLFNVVGSLCVYGNICRHLDLPFVFGGFRRCWEQVYMDASDARLVAEQQIWAANSESTVAIEGEAFNAINGSDFTWKEIWPALAERLGLAVPDSVELMFSPSFSYAGFLEDKGAVWEEIVEREGLVETKMDELANGWLLDALFRVPTNLLVSRRKAHLLGFTVTCETLTSILYWVDSMRNERLIL